ncbi:MAG: hypothetical protein LH474_12300 [Chamaesiphon sp.]|nr:hypothetical protein [Chamaesiphon sp.]
MAKNNYDPVGTLSIGNVVTTSITLYKSNFKRYFQVSLRATGWLLAILLVILVAGLIGGGLYAVTNSSLVAIPVVIGWIVGTLYCSAKYATDRAVICRLAYQELIDAPETVAVATQQLIPRTWGFLRLNWLVSLYISLVAVIASFVLIIAVLIVAAAIIYGLKLPIENPVTIISIALAVIGALFLFIAILVRCYAYWFVAELPLAVEQTRSAHDSIGRSHQLISTVVGRVILIVTIAFLMLIPINTLGSGPSFFGQLMASTSTDLGTQTIGGILMIGGLCLNLLSELFIMPFWQIIKAIVYYDLRNRREGSDLTI